MPTDLARYNWALKHLRSPAKTHCSALAIKNPKLIKLANCVSDHRASSSVSSSCKTWDQDSSAKEISWNKGISWQMCSLQLMCPYCRSGPEELPWVLSVFCIHFGVLIHSDPQPGLPGHSTAVPGKAQDRTFSCPGLSTSRWHRMQWPSR